MTWIRTIVRLIVIGCTLSGCTVKIEPLQKKPASRQHHSKHTRSHPTPTPRQTATPYPQPYYKHQNIYLEPTDKPTPTINVPAPPNNLSLMEYYEKVSMG